jgi:2-polyprenyl-3-methyl-5-hydroxy-6-metoxy-1,4-benzoquinol methylase
MREARCYQNSGNPFIFDFLGPEDRRILDVGCGSGDNAALILSRYPDARVCGITVSEREKKLASGIMESCWLADVETGEPDFLGDLRFDRLLFCHVLEHFKDPGSVLEKFIPYLKPGGKILILVPNAHPVSQAGGEDPDPGPQRRFLETEDEVPVRRHRLRGRGDHGPHARQAVHVP